MESGFTKKAETALQNAAEAAFELGHGSVGSEHILIGLLRTEECIANAVLVNNGVEESKVVELIKELIVPEKNVGLKEPDSYTPRAARILENARKEAKRFKSGLIGTESLFTEDDFKDDNGWFSSEFEGQEVLVKYAIHDDKIIIGMVSYNEIYKRRNTVVKWLMFVIPVLAIGIIKFMAVILFIKNFALIPVWFAFVG
mgnify:CR=1 FL=1